MTETFRATASPVPAESPSETADAVAAGGAPAAAEATRWQRWLGPDDRDRVIALAVLGGVIEVFLIFLTQRFWLTDFFPGPGYSIGFPQMMKGPWNEGAWWLTFVLGAPWLAFIPAVLIARGLRGPLARALIFGFAALFGITLLGMYPITASDVFHYLADGRTLWVYHQNPMQVAPQAHYFVIGISWAEQPSPYGPLWQLLSVIPAALTGDHWAGGVIGFKILAFGFFLVCSGLIYLIVRRTLPGRELAATLLFAWSPFVVLRVAGNGHNDVVMMTFAVAALYFVTRRAWRWALPLLALSALVKFSTLLLVPPVLVFAWFSSDARERRELIVSSGIAALLAVGITSPFWRGFDTFKTFVQNTNLVITSMPQLVVIARKGGGFATSIDGGVRTLGYAAFGLIYLGMLAALARRPRFQDLLSVLTLAVVAYLTLCTWWFRPWYLLWFLPLAAMLPSPWWTWVPVATTIGATYFDLIEQYRVHWPWVEDHVWRSYAAPVLPVFLPLLLGILLAFSLTGRWNLSTGRAPRPAHLDH